MRFTCRPQRSQWLLQSRPPTVSWRGQLHMAYRFRLDAARLASLANESQEFHPFHNPRRNDIRLREEGGSVSIGRAVCQMVTLDGYNDLLAWIAWGHSGRTISRKHT